jgi:hypothetical protein
LVEDSEDVVRALGIPTGSDALHSVDGLAGVDAYSKGLDGRVIGTVNEQRFPNPTIGFDVLLHAVDINFVAHPG